MTVSIFVISAILLAVGFWLYYKKQQGSKPEHLDKQQESKFKRPFNDIEKMLSHVSGNKQTTDDVKSDNDDPPELSEYTQNQGKTGKSETELHERVLGSIILEKKKKK